MALLCHPWFATTNLSYRFPIFETSATALCGTTGIYIYITICICIHTYTCIIIYPTDKRIYRLLNHVDLQHFRDHESWSSGSKSSQTGKQVCGCGSNLHSSKMDALLGEFDHLWCSVWKISPAHTHLIANENYHTFCPSDWVPGTNRPLQQSHVCYGVFKGVFWPLAGNLHKTVSFQWMCVGC